MEKRAYGNTGIQLSILGFGGIVVTDVPQTSADNYVAEAIDHGINYFDVSPNYGNAQEHLGPALKGKRDKLFLACKTEKRNHIEAEAELHQSLKILQTEWVDLYQFHAVKKLNEVETIFAPGGAMEVFQKAQQEGKIRFIGFSAHTEEAALALLDRFQFTSVLFPINWAAMLKEGFGKAIIDKAIEKGTARLALKAMAQTELPENMPKYDRPFAKCWYRPITDERLAGLALRFTLSQPITAAIPPGDIRFFRQALAIAEQFTPVTEGEIAELRQIAGTEKPLFPRVY